MGHESQLSLFCEKASQSSWLGKFLLHEHFCSELILGLRGKGHCALGTGCRPRCVSGVGLPAGLGSMVGCRQDRVFLTASQQVSGGGQHA